MGAPQTKRVAETIIETLEDDKIRGRKEDQRCWNKMLTNLTKPGSGRIRGHPGMGNTDDRATYVPLNLQGLPKPPGNINITQEAPNAWGQKGQPPSDLGV
jgi:hypothetical protein